MSENIHVPVKNLKLDLENLRTIHQPNELSSAHALIANSPSYFWGLMESLMEDGYLPTENIIVLKQGKDGENLITKEGNRRIAALKLIFNYLDRTAIHIPSRIEKNIALLSTKWKTENKTVPCTIYEDHEKHIVDKLVSLIHGKGVQAGRLDWNAVARARENRQKNPKDEPGLDILEKYLEHGKNLTVNQREVWGGNFALSVLDAVITRKEFYIRLEHTSFRALVDNYPKIKYKEEVDNIIKDIGIGELGFSTIRTEDFAQKYNIPPLKSSASAPVASTAATSSQNTTPTASSQTMGTSGPVATRKRRSLASNDPKSVKYELSKFCPTGSGRGKVVVLLNEMRALNLKKNPHAFCFLLRSIFEISAKAYCHDHAQKGGPASQQSGNDRKLIDILNDIEKHLTNNGQNKLLQKWLHPSMVELNRPHSLFSVTSMNQLIHNSHFTVDETHICTVFSNLLPLLKVMNR